MNKHILFSLLLACCALLMHSILPDSLKEALRKQREELIEIRKELTQLQIEAAVQKHKAKINALEGELLRSQSQIISLNLELSISKQNFKELETASAAPVAFVLSHAKGHNPKAFAAFENSCQEEQYKINDPETQKDLNEFGLLAPDSHQISRTLCAMYHEYKTALEREYSKEQLK